MQDFKLDGRIWLCQNGESVLGKGKISLLENIHELGSLNKAAKAMKMSYRKAWYSINQINETSQKQIVELTRGGKDGGHAKLTAYGHEVLSYYNSQKKAFEAFLKKQNQ